LAKASFAKDFAIAKNATAFPVGVNAIVGRSRYAAEKKSKIVYNSYTCPISGTFKKGVYHESNRSKSI